MSSKDCELNSPADSSSSSDQAKLSAELGDGIGLMAVAGLAVTLIVAMGWILGEDVNHRRPILYVAFGTIFPSLLIASVLLTCLGGWARTVRKFITTVFCAIGALATLSFVYDHFDIQLLVLSILSAAVYLVASTHLHSQPIAWRTQCVRALMCFPIMVVSWFFSVRLVYGLTGNPDVWLPDYRVELLGSSYKILLLLFSVFLTAVNLRFVTFKNYDFSRQQSFGRRLVILSNVIAFVLIGWASTRIDSLGNSVAGIIRFHHWGCVAGPAELVRQGGWPLWDVPVFYGFLSTLTIACLPFQSVWQSLYVVHVSLLFLSASMIFLILRALATGPLNFLFSLVVTLTAVFLVTSPWIHPPFGAFRYIWCYVLLGVLLWEYRRPLSPGTHWKTLTAGSVAWLLGVMWSPESLIYCTAAWVPAYSLMIWRRAVREVPGQTTTLISRSSVVFWLFLPLFLLLGSLGFLSVYYKLFLGYFPDYVAYFDYVLAFTGDRPDLPHLRPHLMNVQGPVWVLMLVFCMISTFAVLVAQRDSRSPAMPLVFGAWGILWSCSGYYVVRGGDGFLLNISPIICLCMVLVLYVSKDFVRAFALRAALIPVLSVMVTIGFGDTQRLRDWVPPLRRAYIKTIDKTLPAIDVSLGKLFESANIRADDPIAYCDFHKHTCSLNPLPVIPDRSQEGSSNASSHRWQNQAWLPATPLALHLGLAPERSRVYMNRFIERTKSSGWLIESKVGHLDTIYPWLFEELSRTHTPLRILEDDKWKLTYYEYQGGTVRPEIALEGQDSSASIKRR